MSFSSLPEELVDVIADLVGRLPNDIYSIDRTSLLSFCLVSKTTFHSAQPVLYRLPFLGLGHTNRDTGQAQARVDRLLPALEANDGRLGRLVRETSGVDQLLRLIGVGDWYRRVIRICPRLRQVDLKFHTKDELEQLLQDLFPRYPATEAPLASSLPSLPPSDLRSIDFHPLSTTPYPNQNILYSEVFECLQQTPIRSLDRISFMYLRWKMPRQSTYFGPSVPFPIEHVFIAIQDELEIAFTLCPRLIDSLESFYFSNVNDTERTDLCALPGNVGKNLRTLSLDFLFFQFRNDRSLATYSESSHGPSLPPQAFESFPHLETLVLGGTHGPSLQSFETLLQCSPLLRFISFLESRWISYSNPTSTNSDDIFPEAQLSYVLPNFSYLYFVQLGVLPTIDPLRYKTFKSTLEQAGIRSEYTICQQA